MGFAWTTAVGVNDPIEGWPTNFGDIREMRMVADYLFNNMCSTHYTGVLYSERVTEKVGEDKDEKSGNQASGHTCDSDYLDKGDDGTYLEHNGTVLNEADSEEVSDKTSDLATNKTSNDTSDYATADSGKNSWYSD